MDNVQKVAELVRLMSSYGYRHIANEYAAAHALRSASTYKGEEQKIALGHALAELVAAKAVFDVSSTYRMCLAAQESIDIAARSGIRLDVQDAIELTTEDDNV